MAGWKAALDQKQEQLEQRFVAHRRPSILREDDLPESVSYVSIRGEAGGGGCFFDLVINDLDDREEDLLESQVNAKLQERGIDPSTGW